VACSITAHYVIFSITYLRKLCKKEISDHIEMNEMGGTCSSYGKSRVVYRVLVRKPEGKRPLGRSRLRWEDNIKMDLQEVVLGGLD